MQNLIKFLPMMRKKKVICSSKLWRFSPFCWLWKFATKKHRYSQVSIIVVIQCFAIMVLTTLSFQRSNLLVGILFHSSILSQILINFPIRTCQTHASCLALILCPLDFLAFVTQEHQSTNLEFVWPSNDPSQYSSSSISRRKTKGTSSGIMLLLPHSKTNEIQFQTCSNNTPICHKK